MNNTNTFNHPLFGDIRTIEQKNDVWFVAIDVAKSLGYDQPDKAIRQHCKGGVLYGIDVKRGMGLATVNMLIIPEGDIYRLIMRSRLPAAEQFEEWVVSEVLPSIRKTGSYNPIDIDTLTPAEKIARSNAACLELANQFGFSGNQALLSAAKATEALTGHNPIKLLGVELKSDRKEKTYTVTELGREFFDGMSAQKLNRLFEAAKLQNRVAGQWELTGKGKEHAEILDTGKKRSKGTPVKQIKWFKSVVEEI